jgi:hypothetical protein
MKSEVRSASDLLSGGGEVGKKAEMEVEAKYDDGQWYTVTLGHFIGLLVDAGQDVAVKFRVLGDSEPNEGGAFVRHMEMFLLPNGYVVGAAQGDRVHKTLMALIEKGLVK